MSTSRHGKNLELSNRDAGTSEPNPAQRPARAPNHDEIARRAYELFEERGREPGHEWEDWFRAEREYEEG